MSKGWRVAGADLTGKKFGKLSVLRLLDKRHNKHRVFLCRCDCGTEIEVTYNNLNSGNSTSCGCKKRKLNGLWSHPLHEIWRSMMRRCYEVDKIHYPNYGGRGIKVCERWHSFLNFYEDMESAYKKGLSIDRINNDGNYEPSNCRWATALEQNWNRRDVKLYKYKGEDLPLKAIARLTGIPSPTLYWRRKHGKPLGF